MARIRTIKPEFWKHEELSEQPEATHMLAAALLNYADDHGYFNANPKLVQAECCPLREPSVSILESLRSLQTIGYIRLGTGADGKRYGHVIEFDKHQRVSHPSKSKIADIPITWDNSGNPPEDSCTPHETLRPEQGTGNREQGSGTGKGIARSADADVPAAFEAYNSLAEETGWPKAQHLTPKRRSAIKARLAECGGIDGWNAAMAKARASPFLRGETGRDRAHEKWTPDLDFLSQQSSFVKLMEGKYDDRNSNQAATGFSAVLAGGRAAASGEPVRN